MRWRDAEHAPRPMPGGRFCGRDARGQALGDRRAGTMLELMRATLGNALKLATWNVNSLKVRLPQVLDWLAATSADVLCLQETKLVDPKFPVDALAQAGYDAAFVGQPTYNGVAILTRRASVGAPREAHARALTTAGCGT